MTRLNYGKRFQNGARVSVGYRYDPALDAPVVPFAKSSPITIARVGKAHAVLKLRRERETGGSVREREAAEELAATAIGEAVAKLESAIDLLGMAMIPSAKYLGRVRQKPLIDVVHTIKNKVLI